MDIDHFHRRLLARKEELQQLLLRGHYLPVFLFHFAFLQLNLQMGGGVVHGNGSGRVYRIRRGH